MTQDRFAGSTGASPFSAWISRCILRSLPLLGGMLLLFPPLVSKPAHARPPYSSGLNGTWVNTQSSGLIAQVVIFGGGGSYQTHLYGFCSPAPCDWGNYEPSPFSDDVTSNSAVGFRLTISSSSDNKTVQGHLSGTGTLEITTQISYPQGSSNNNYEVTDEFQLQGATGGPAPKLPSNPSALTGTWTAVKSEGGLTQITIAESGGAFQIHPYGACSPTDCDWGVQSATQFSDSPTSSTPVGFQSSINQGFASRFLQGHLILSSTGETLLEVTTQSTFVASDARYDYELTEDFQLVTTGSPSFSMNPASSSLTISSGGEATDVITITPVNGTWDSAVQLSCSVAGISPRPTCSLSEGSVTPGPSAVTSTLVVNMPMVAALDSKRLPHWIPYVVLTPLAVGLAFAGSFERRRRGCKILCMLAVLAVCSLGPLACGGNATNNNATMQQASGPYTVEVVANSANIQLASQITVTMK
jgi:hypothetical protein